MFLKTYTCFEDMLDNICMTQILEIWVYINNKNLQKTLLAGDRLGKFK